MEQEYGGKVAERLLELTSTAGTGAMKQLDDGVYMMPEYADMVERRVDWIVWNPDCALPGAEPLEDKLLPIPFSGRDLAAFMLCPVAHELMDIFGGDGTLDEDALNYTLAGVRDTRCKEAVRDAYGHLARAASRVGTKDEALWSAADQLAEEHERQRDAARARLGIASVSSHGLSSSEYSTQTERANDEVKDLERSVVEAWERAKQQELDWRRQMVLAIYEREALGHAITALGDDFGTEGRRNQPAQVPNQAVPETAEQRQARRYQMCIDAGLVMPDNDYARLPDGVSAVAQLEGISLQAFSKDVKKHIARMVE